MKARSELDPMHEEFEQVLKKFPLIASKNPQLNLLDEEQQTQLVIQQSDLYRKIWNQQKKRFTRFAGDALARTYVASADRFRDTTRSHPIETGPSIEWPTFGGLFSEGADEPGSDTFYPAVLPTREQDRNLLLLLEKISQHLTFALSQPSLVFEDRYSIRVEFLDCIAWVALKIERLIKMEIKDSQGNWQLSTFRFNLLKPMQTKSWIDQVLLAWIDEIVISFPEAAGQAYDWLRSALEKRFHNESSLRGIRQQVRHHMSVDPGMIEAFLHIRKQAGMRQALMNTEVSDMWPTADFWAELHQKHANLTLLCHLATKGKQGRFIQNVNEVRSMCLEHGLSPSGWRYLLKAGEKCYLAIIDSGVSENKAFPIAIRLIEWQNRSGSKRPLPIELTRAFVNFAAVTLAEDLDFAQYLDPRIARIATRQFLKLERAEERAAFVERDWLDVLIWMRNTQPDIDNNQWKSGWSCIWKKYNTWLGERDTTKEWESRVSAISILGMTVNPLTSTRDLCLEGLKMNHCVASYVKECRKGTYRVFSICEKKTEKRVATAGLAFQNGIWKLDQVKGKNNRKVGSKIESLSRSLAQFYQQSHWQHKARAPVPINRQGSEIKLRDDGFYHLKISDNNHLLTRNGRGEWALAQTSEYPISSELKARFEAFRAGSVNHDDIPTAELILSLRLELPREFAVYVWDSAKNQDRLLSVSS